MREYIEERAVEIANYIIENNATVRQTAKQFRISKSTVHKDVTIQNYLRRYTIRLIRKKDMHVKTSIRESLQDLKNKFCDHKEKWN